MAGKGLALLLPLLLVALLGCCDLATGHGHGHDDGHGHGHDQDPAFKWSRQANEDAIIDEADFAEEDIIDVPAGFSDEPPKGHGHAHEAHGHGGRGHSHGGHGHSHGPPQREPTKEEREKHRERLHKLWDEDEEEEDGASIFGGVPNMWLYALGSTLAISIFPFVILFFFNLDNTPEKEGWMKILLGFAAGGLLGDAFLHLIPHAIMASEGGHGHSHGGGGDHGHSHNHGHSHGGEGEGHSHDLTVGLMVLAGILAFLLVEKFMRIFAGGGHGHSHEQPKKKEKKDKKKDKKSTKGDDEDKKDKKGKKEEEKEQEEEDSKDDGEEEGEVQVAGYLNLAADSFHNFTDGMAIGASFLAGRTVGLFTTFTILFHEIPHEIGDYAILVQSGVPSFKAKMLQLVTAVGAISGCLFSLAFGALGEWVNVYILPFTAGGFIYIAAVNVIPDLLKGATTVRQSFWEVMSMLVGVGMMVVISWYE